MSVGTQSRGPFAGPSLVRVPHATATRAFEHPAGDVFNAFTRWARYETWAPEVQGAAEWLSIRAGGIGSRFLLHDRPGPVHLLHDAEVTDLEPDRRFVWRAPFSEWSRAFLGTSIEVRSDGDRRTEVTETLFVEAAEEHLPVVRAFLAQPGLDGATFERFLGARLAGLARLLDAGELSAEERSLLFTTDRQVAADWPGRIAEGEWVRVLYADGELDFDAPAELVFNAFSRFARYPDWTRAIHVAAEWLDIRAGGVGSRFLLWEKPAGRQVLHRAVVTELEPNRRFTWRAPFSEWGKVFIGTSMILEPRGSETHSYHVLYADLPAAYVPVFGAFGTLRGFDLEFETLHIHEEARGFNRLLQAGAFSGEDGKFLFDRDRQIARDWPLQDGRPWPEAALTLRPSRMLTFEELTVEVAGTLVDAIPRPAFLRRYRGLNRTRRYTDGWLDGR